MHLEFIEARDLPDAWFQCVYRILDTGLEYTIDKGSFAGWGNYSRFQRPAPL